ncbi:hypothetical protein Fcan01_19022 [Folsomia candida]|uniref:Uncharacterized protein n=1 Tax=Folsomia candida TaxID=158441 RepID=A0A226DNX2_FOLCA|nr:hypothetical protein Fcan01_19022 [Folsomia candida]
MRQTIIVKVIKNNGEIVTHEFGSRFKNDGRNPLIVDYTPPNMENEGHYSIPDEILAKLKGFDINSFTPTGQNNCLYDALLPQINAETGQNLALTADKLRNIAEEFTLSNLCGNILHVASSLLNNPLTKQLHIKAQAALLVGGGISEAKDLKQKFIEQLKQLNLPGPDRTNLTLEKACHHDNKAISKINDMSPTLKKSKATQIRGRP